MDIWITLFPQFEPLIQHDDISIHCMLDCTLLGWLSRLYMKSHNVHTPFTNSTNVSQSGDSSTELQTKHMNERWENFNSTVSIYSY